VGRCCAASPLAFWRLTLLGVSACGGNKGPKTFTTQKRRAGPQSVQALRRRNKAAPAKARSASTAILWRASLDTLAFMPLASADPYGGVIVTDWYVNPEKPDERFKATVYILDTRLRADGLNVTIFKQVQGRRGGWVDAAATDQTATDIENAILTRARQLRLSNIKN
jgi:hypothetical protein